MLSSAIYEMVLNEYLMTDHIGFQQLIKEWPTDLYQTSTIVTALQSVLEEEPDNTILLQTLGTLYAHEKR